MSLVGLDVNASRIRAVRGPVGDYPWTAPLDPPHADVPLVLSLRGRTPIVGAPGLRVCRKSPHLAWQNFLPQIGKPPALGACGAESRTKLDAAKVFSLALRKTATVAQESAGVVVALPAYFSDCQIEAALKVVQKTGLPVLGSIVAPLAAALTAHAEQAWFSGAVVVDVDDQALTVGTVSGTQEKAQLLAVQCFPQLNLRAWQERLLNAFADCCILDSRWDPRESPEAEQLLFDQLNDVLEGALNGRAVKVTIQTPGRYQNLLLQPGDAGTFCSNLRRQAVAEIANIFTGPWPEGGPGAILVTAAAARLPGLVADLQATLLEVAPAKVRKKKTSLSAIEDFGSGLLDDCRDEPRCVTVLAACAVARGAHSVAAQFQRGDIPCGHLHAAAPLPLPQPLEAGPARLYYQGREYSLGTGSFALGRHAGADLVFDAEEWPNISARHCDITYKHRSHLLCNRCREGTLVNDRPAAKAVPLQPGDWIRLGTNGPLLRFLGQSEEIRTTA